MVLSTRWDIHFFMNVRPESLSSQHQYIHRLTLQQSIYYSGVKFPQNLLTLKVLIFHLDAKNEEKVRNFWKFHWPCLKINLQMRVGEWNFTPLPLKIKQ